MYVSTASIDMYTHIPNGQTNRQLPTPSSQCLQAVVGTQNKLPQVGHNSYMNEIILIANVQLCLLQPTPYTINSS